MDREQFKRILLEASELQLAIVKDLETIMEGKPLNEQQAANRLDQLRTKTTIISNVSTKIEIHGNNKHS